MIIKGNLADYKVTWEESGWSYAIPVVKVKKKVFGLPFRYWSKVWEGGSKPRLSAEHALPSEITDWFERSVERYENYLIAWEEALNIK